MTTRFVPNMLGIEMIGRTSAMEEDMKSIAEQMADHVRANGPRDDSEPHYVDDISVDTGLDDSVAIARVNANKFTSWWIEAGTSDTPVFQPLRKAAEARLHPPEQDMTQVNTFPDAQALASAVIREADTDAGERVYSSIPKDPRYPLIVVKRIGGIATVRQYLDAASLQIEVWGKSQTEAFTIAQDARVALFGMEGVAFSTSDGWPVDAWVSGVDDSLGLTWSPDQFTTRDRYIFGLMVYLH